MAGEFARIAGVQADNIGQQAYAQRLWLAGLHAAHTSGDRSIGANILGFMSRQALGRPHDAETYYRHALADGDAHPHYRALSLCRLAMARVQARELDGACRAATEAATMNRRLGSQRIRNQLIEFRRAVQPHAAATPAKDFDAKFADLLRTTAAAH